MPAVQHDSPFFPFFPFFPSFALCLLQGKGDMTTWWLEAKRDDHTDPEPLMTANDYREIPVQVWPKKIKKPVI